VADSGQCCLMAINWPELRAAAMEVASRAYAPYSRLRVGAAGLTGDGRVVTGCNVENASYGLTLCAECGLVSALHAMPPPATDGAAPPLLIAVAVVAGDGDPLLPCGRCRQLLLELPSRTCYPPRSAPLTWPPAAIRPRRPCRPSRTTEASCYTSPRGATAPCQTSYH
jgi:cytidine deaminase